MSIKWEKWDPDRISPRELLSFRNRSLGIKGEPSLEELHAMKLHLVELSYDKSIYNLVAYKGERVIAWMSGKFSESRLTDIVRSLFFDHAVLSSQDVDDLLYQLEVSLPQPFHRIEIHGLGPGRENTSRLVFKSGYNPAYKVNYFQRKIGDKKPQISENNGFEFDHNIYIHTAYDIYRNAFSATWDRDMIAQAELVPVIDASDDRFSFLAFHGESPAGLVLTNRGLSDDDSYLQTIAVQPRMRGKRVGDSMMNHLENELADANIRTISLSTYSDNDPMNRFLERWGFRLLYGETVLFKDDFVTKDKSTEDVPES